MFGNMDWLKSSLQAAQKQAQEAAEKVQAQGRVLMEQASVQAKVLAEQASEKAKILAEKAAEEAQQAQKKLRDLANTTIKADEDKEDTGPTPQELAEYGVTPGLVETVAAMTYSTFSDYPMDALPSTNPLGLTTAEPPRNFRLTPWQEHHALLVLTCAENLQGLRFALCPRRMTEEQFWVVYFTLVKTLLPPKAFEPAPAAVESQPSSAKAASGNAGADPTQPAASGPSSSTATKPSGAAGGAAAAAIGATSAAAQAAATASSLASTGISNAAAAMRSLFGGAAAADKQQQDAAGTSKKDTPGADLASVATSTASPSTPAAGKASASGQQHLQQSPGADGLPSASSGPAADTSPMSSGVGAGSNTPGGGRRRGGGGSGGGHQPTSDEAELLGDDLSVSLNDEDLDKLNDELEDDPELAAYLEEALDVDDGGDGDGDDDASALDDLDDYINQLNDELQEDANAEDKDPNAQAAAGSEENEDSSADKQ